MRKAMENEIDKRYSEILKKMYINWKLGFKSKIEEITQKGLIASGVGMKILYNFIEKLILNTCEELEIMFENIKKEFSSNISLKVLRRYIDKSEKSIIGHLDNMEKDIINKFGNDILLETNKVTINNLKGNIKVKLERIYDKNKNLQEYKKVEWPVIIEIIIGITGLIIAIIAL